MIRHPSPNFGPRRDGLQPELIVLHYTEMSSAEAALDRLCAPEAQVSSHYLIGADGRLWQLVDEAARAWHAGAGAWRGQGDVNSRSIGIELDNDGRSPFTEPQIRALESLLPAIMTRWQIAPAGVIAHSDLAPERKMDPGPRFDWRRLALRGLAIWPWTLENADAALAESLDRIGYPRVPPETRLAAFRLRFHPGATGPEAAEDRSLAAAVAAAC
ncbi:N-acetylmuramoyl-L-alanine amidase [Pararhodobacter sp. SW119]|uniref:N-acetylmuramoyl-L-alanine amidase n=1 Tax=Pararhodobacter sp. SW119 TaxID=2780075 RepID=UPI001ADED8D5|nr:N-acetylmuramoyl-L-alanine amidase [Pararhodobacter sp. SW119]